MQQNYSLGITGNEMRLSACDCALDMGQEQYGRSARMAGGALKRDIVAVHRRWSFHWSFLPGKKRNTFDNGLGRDELDNLHGLLADYPGQTLTLKAPREDGTEESVGVQFVAGSWREKLLQRETSLGSVWDLSFSLEEVTDARTRTLPLDMSLPWYTSGVVAAGYVKAVYEAKGAANLAGSYVNKVNAGTYDAAPGNAPTWSALRGWIFDGAADYLVTGIPMVGNDYSVLIRYANYTTAAGTETLFGYADSEDDRFMALLHYTDTKTWASVAGDSDYAEDAAAASGVLCLTYDALYRDGVLEIVLGAGSGTNGTADLYIGALESGGGALYFCPADVLYMAVYSCKLTTAQQQVLSARVALL